MSNRNNVNMKNKFQKILVIATLILTSLVLPFICGGCIWGHGDHGGWHEHGHR